MSPTPPTHIQNLADDYVPRPAILAVAHFPPQLPRPAGVGVAFRYGARRGGSDRGDRGRCGADLWTWRYRRCCSRQAFWAGTNRLSDVGVGWASCWTVLMSGERRIELLRPGLLAIWREHNPDDVICRAGDRMAEPTLNGPRLGTGTR